MPKTSPCFSQAQHQANLPASNPVPGMRRLCSDRDRTDALSPDFQRYLVRDNCFLAGKGLGAPTCSTYCPSWIGTPRRPWGTARTPGQGLAGRFENGHKPSVSRRRTGQRPQPDVRHGLPAQIGEFHEGLPEHGRQPSLYQRLQSQGKCGYGTLHAHAQGGTGLDQRFTSPSTFQEALGRWLDGYSTNSRHSATGRRRTSRQNTLAVRLS